MELSMDLNERYETNRNTKNRNKKLATIFCIIQTLQDMYHIFDFAKS